MRLYHSMTKKLERLEPQGEGFSVYACGITPYDTTHLGHAFTYTCADVLIRYLEFLGHKVTYVQNVTDIDDDILRRAKEVDEDWHALGNRWTIHYIEDMISLNVRAPEHFPRATDVIPEIQDWVNKLIMAGVAYQSNGNIYFHIDAWPEFGKLNQLPRSEMLSIANQRGNRPDDPHKRDPLDFVLWQAQTRGEPAWDSPWGPGRPGWHIECSTLSIQLLGEVVDIHIGGSDLSFPHHECEIAQVEPVTHRIPFVRFWMHVAMVYHEGEKMSKSLGNLIMVRDLLGTWSPDTLRLSLGSHHYREVWSLQDGDLQRAKESARKLCSAARAPSGKGVPIDPAPALSAFRQAMDSDLDTPSALRVLDDLAQQILDSSANGKQVNDAQRALRAMGGIFGLRFDREEPEEQVILNWQRHMNRFTNDKY
jgi:L-cysteine:1D-myo-inositol 2-amino-2-deoxy-alpha-D-glucopyranoside ligase